MDAQPARRTRIVEIVAILFLIIPTVLLCTGLLTVYAAARGIILYGYGYGQQAPHATPITTTTAIATRTPAPRPTVAPTAMPAASTTVASIDSATDNPLYAQIHHNPYQQPATGMNETVEGANEAWTKALMIGNTSTAFDLYRPVIGSSDDPYADVRDYVGQMYAAMHRADELRDVRYAGAYALPDTPGLRYAISGLIFDRGSICLQTTLIDGGSEGWYVQAWDSLALDECKAALAQIKAAQG